MPILVVARYLDGRLIKGTTINFRPDADHCHVVPLERPYGEGARVDYRDLKAIFFVRDLRGNPEYKDQMTFTRPTGYGTRVRVVFKDSEKMVGIVHHLDPNLHGFFLFPADPYSNNERVYAMYRAVASVEPLDRQAEPAAAAPPEGGSGTDGAGPARAEPAAAVVDADSEKRGRESKAAADSRADRAIAAALEALKVRPSGEEARGGEATPAKAPAPAPASPTSGPSSAPAAAPPPASAPPPAAPSA